MPTDTGPLTEADATEKNLVDSTIQQLNATYLESERKIHQLRKLRFMKTQTRAPKPFQRVVGGGIRSPLSYRLVQTVVGMICKERPHFKRIPRNSSDRAGASALQMSADPMLQDLERIARRPLYYQAVDALVADGRSIIKCYRDAWHGFPDQIEGEDDPGYNRRVAEFVMSGAQHPLRQRQVDALNFKTPLTDYDPPYVMEAGKRATLAVAKAYGLNFGINNKIETMPEGTAFHTLELPSGIPPTIDVEELWMDDCVYVRIAGKVFKADNDLGFKPYVWGSGETSSHPDPSLNSLSILYPFAGIEPWLNTMLTVLASWGVIGGTPILFTSRKIPPGAGGVPDVQPTLSDIPLGKRIDLGMGGEIGFVQPPPVGREVLEFIQFLVDFLDRAGLPQLAYGSIGTRTPGTAFQGALEQAIAKVNPITSSAENMMAEVVKMQWRIIEQLGQPMYVTGIGMSPGILGKRKSLSRYVIKPSDIGGYYDLHAKIRVGNTQDVISRGMHAAFMRSHKLWSRDRAMEYADVDDPFDEYKTIMRDTMEESPVIQEIMIAEALKQEPEIMARAQNLQDQGVPIMEMLGMAQGASDEPTPHTSGGGGGGAQPAGSAPAPKRGGKPKGSPKRPGGTRQNAQGSRGHS